MSGARHTMTPEEEAGFMANPASFARNGTGLLVFIDEPQCEACGGPVTRGSRRCRACFSSASLLRGRCLDCGAPLSSYRPKRCRGCARLARRKARAERAELNVEEPAAATTTDTPTAIPPVSAPPRALAEVVDAYWEAHPALTRKQAEFAINRVARRKPPSLA